MRTEKKFKTKAVFFVILAAIMIILQLPQQVCATEQKDTIVVGTNAEYAPFEYLDSNGNLIVIPQAVKNILPAMGNEFIQLIKETSILGYVGIVDLTKAASYVSSRTYKMFIPLLAAGIVYYLIVKLLSVFLRKFERRLKESD